MPAGFTLKTGVKQGIIYDSNYLLSRPAVSTTRDVKYVELEMYMKDYIPSRADMDSLLADLDSVEPGTPAHDAIQTRIMDAAAKREVQDRLNSHILTRVLAEARS